MHFPKLRTKRGLTAGIPVLLSTVAGSLLLKNSSAGIKACHSEELRPAPPGQYDTNRKPDLFCILFLYSRFAACTKAYPTGPFPDGKAGAVINDSKGPEFKAPGLSWQFLLGLVLPVLVLLGLARVQSIPAPSLLFSAKLIFTITGFRGADLSVDPGKLKRKNIYAFIKARPGAYIGEIANNTGLSRGTLRHHLKVLEKENMVKAHCYFGKARYFQNNSTYGEIEKRVISVFQNETARKIVSKILKKECNTNRDLAREMGFSRGTISWYMKQLKESDLIEENRVGRSAIYSINPVYRDAIERFQLKFQAI